MTTQDPWDTSSGLLDDFDFLVKEAWFGMNDNDRMQATFRGEAFKDGELVEEEFDIWYSLGSGWEEVGGGASVKNRTGSALFNDSTGMGRLIESFKAIPGAIDELRSRGAPTDAATWEGLAYHVKRTKFGTFTPTGETEPRDVMVAIATELLDPDDLGGEPKKKGRGKAAAKPRASRAKAKDEEEAPKPRRRSRAKVKDLRDEVLEFASEFDDHGEFVKAVFDADEFPRAEEAEADEELAEEILDSEGELWEESRE